MTRIKWLFLALFFAPLAFGQVPRTITLERATERVNGDPLTLAEIDAHVIECYAVGGEPLFTLERPPAETQISTPESFVDGVNYQCRALTRDTDGLVSDWTESAVFTVGRCEVQDCRPMPPWSIVISVN